MNTALVVPTIRESSINEFLEIWQSIHGATWDHIVIVEDNPNKTFDLWSATDKLHLSWEDIENDLGENSWIISRRDSAIRSYGFWKAWQLGADIIYTLDDDCFPAKGHDFVKQHLHNLTNTSKWCESVLGYRTRGLPYHNMGTMDNVMFSMGFWEGVPDLDAIHMLTDHLGKPQFPKTRVMPRGQYFPFCGMNFAFKREVAPLTYFPLMGRDSPYGRFDDIWFGVICKKICDHLDFAITVGEPHIHHSKASNAFVNLVKEAPGIKANETFWESVDIIGLRASTPADCMCEIGVALMENSDQYLAKIGKALTVWSGLFSNPENTANYHQATL